jgi:hypothetical protein
VPATESHDPVICPPRTTLVSLAFSRTHTVRLKADATDNRKTLYVMSVFSAALVGEQPTLFNVPIEKLW